MSLEDYCSRHDLIDEILEKAKVIRKHVEEYLSSGSQEWSLLDIEDDVKKFLRNDPLAYIIGAICDQ